MDVKSHLPLEELKRLERVEKDANRASTTVGLPWFRPKMYLLG
jgi:hypothetical protein